MVSVQYAGCSELQVLNILGSTGSATVEVHVARLGPESAPDRADLLDVVPTARGVGHEGAVEVHAELPGFAAAVPEDEVVVAQLIVAVSRDGVSTLMGGGHGGHGSHGCDGCNASLLDPRHDGLLQMRLT